MTMHIEYGDWVILPARGICPLWGFYHKDVDDDANDNRHSTGHSICDCKRQIDDWKDEH